MEEQQVDPAQSNQLFPSGMHSQPLTQNFTEEKPISKKNPVLKILLIMLFALGILMGGYFGYNYVHAKGFHEIKINGIGKDKESANFMIRNGWVEKQRQPDNTGYDIELFPSEKEFAKAMDVLKTPGNNIIYPFRAINGTAMGTSTIFSDPTKMEKLRATYMKINTFEKFVEIEKSDNLKNIFCHQEHKDNLVMLSCIFELTNAKNYGLILYSDDAHYKLDYETFEKIVHTIRI